MCGMTRAAILVEDAERKREGVRARIEERTAEQVKPKFAYNSNSLVVSLTGLSFTYIYMLVTSFYNGSAIRG